MTTVAAIEVETVRLPLPAPLALGRSTIADREYAIVRVHGDDGSTGSAYCLTRNAPVAECVSRLIGPAIVGVPFEAPADAWQAAYDANVLVGRAGLVLRALGLVDVAVWDLSARQSAQPLWRLLGGVEREVETIMIAAYPTAGTSLAELTEQVGAYADDGYRLLKVARASAPGATAEWLGLLGERIGRLDGLIVDAGYAWRSAAEALEELASWPAPELAWVEDPLPPEHAAECAQLRQRCGYRLGIGDEVSSLETYLQLLDHQAIDVLRVDVVAVGGVTPALRAIDAARAHGVPVSFHVYPEVAVQLASTAPGSTIEVFDAAVEGGSPLDPAHLLVDEPLRVRAGRAVLPSRPGHGFSLRQEAAVR